MVRAVSTPVTVKIRSGWNEHQWVDVEFAKIARDCGVSAITVPARSRTMGCGGRAYWERIALVKQSVSIPVIGNGDVTDGESAVRMLNETGCDAVMIGRGALGNPWIFSQAKQCMAGEAPLDVSASMRLDAAREHLAAYCRAYGGQRAAREMKKHLAWYVKGLPQASVTRQKFFAARSSLELERILDEYSGA
jgi:nifR3 family TIM-barrel protein